MQSFHFAQRTPQQTLKEFGVSVGRGLSRIQVNKRIQKLGLNDWHAQEVSGVSILGNQLRSPFVYLLILAMGLTFFLQNWFEGFFILFIILLDIGFGFYQEYHARKTVLMLRKYLVSRVLVRREGKEFLMDSHQLVPGDIVLLSSGDKVPADLRILLEEHLFVDESVLSGESEPVLKMVQTQEKASSIFEAHNLLFAGTFLTQGTCTGVVVATGKRTVLGAVSTNGHAFKPSTLQVGLKQLTAFLIRMIALTLALILFLQYVISGEAFSWGEFLVFLIALFVSVIPESLPLITLFSLSQAARQLARQRVIIRRLSAIEDLGNIQVLCTDKTGTLTENKMTVTDVWPSKSQDVFFYAGLAISVIPSKKQDITNPFDIALWKALSKKQQGERKKAKILKEIPFDPVRKYQEVFLQHHGQTVWVLRGAPELILEVCGHVSHQDAYDMQHFLVSQGEKGRRVLGVAVRLNEEKQFRFVGCVSFADPIKKTSFSAISQAKSLGVQIKMLTGDRPEVAYATALEVGIVQTSDQMITGDDWHVLSKEEQKKVVMTCHVFARVTPEDKLRIISLISAQKVVGFLGEGMNDIPAMQQAQVAIAVSQACDMAQETAEIVLLHKSLHAIVSAIEYGRKSYINTWKYIQATISANVGNFYAVGLASLFIPFLPMLPIQLLLVNLLTDVPLLTLSTDQVDPKQLRHFHNLDFKDMLLLGVFLGVVSTVFDVIMFLFFSGMGAQTLQTMWFMGSVLTELVFIFSIRTRSWMWKGVAPSKPLVAMTLLVSGLVLVLPYTVFGQTLFSFTAPGAGSILLLLGILVGYVVVTELTKVSYDYFMKSKQHLS